MIDPSPSEMDGTPPPRFSFSVRGLLFFTAATSAVLAIAVAFGSPEVASGAAVLCLYGFAVRYQFGDQGPLVIWTIGALMLVASLAVSRADPDSFFTLLPLAFFGSMGLGIAAFSYLLMAAVAKKDRLRWQNASCVFLSGATWLLWLLVGVGSIGAERRAEQVRRAAEDPIKLQKLIDDTNAVVQRLGRTPEDQAELVAELGYPLPKVLDGSTESPVSYQRYTDSRFILHYELWATGRLDLRQLQTGGRLGAELLLKIKSQFRAPLGPARHLTGHGRETQARPDGRTDCLAHPAGRAAGAEAGDDFAELSRIPISAVTPGADVSGSLNRVSRLVAGTMWECDSVRFKQLSFACS